MYNNVPKKNIGYLILRLLIETKKGQPLKKRKFLKDCSSYLSSAIENDKNAKSTIENIFTKYEKIKFDLIRFIETKEDLKILYNITDVIGPETLNALEQINKNKIIELAQKNAKTRLSEEHDKAIESLITDWDDFTYENSMILESEAAKKLMDKLTDQFNLSKYPLDNEIKSYLLSASMMEFERRAFQSRKGRAGDNLQQAVKIILEHIGINFNPVPHYISGILEADLVIYKGGPASGKMCVISCKRTGRERVKQVSVEKEELSRLRIEHIIWFFVKFDQSVQRAIDLGLRKHIFYLPDKSEEYKKLNGNPKTSKYVLPISQIRTSIHKLF